MKSEICFIFLALFLASCAIHTGNTSSNASVTNDNFRIMDLAIGQAQTTQVFGIGGLRPDAFVLEAKSAMYRNHPLEPGQIYANVAVDYKRSFYLIVVTTMVTVSADVVQFNPSEEQKQADLFSKENDVLSHLARERESTRRESAKNYLNSGQVVGVYTAGELKNMRVESHLGKNRYELISSDSSKFIFNTKSIYLIDEEDINFLHGYSLGDQAKWEKGGETKTGIVLGVNENSLLIEYENKVAEFSPKDLLSNETE